MHAIDIQKKCFKTYVSELLWTAPEILRNEGCKLKLDAETYAKGDVYSFGIICHEIIMRCAPFEGCELEVEGYLLVTTFV